MTTVRATGVRLVIALAFGFAAVALWAADGGPDTSTRFRGRPLIAVLDDFKALGLNLIYSSAVVPSELVVVDEPLATDARAILDEILVPLGLSTRAGAQGAILIVVASPRSVGAVTGRVTASARGRPVAGATLAVDGTECRVTTGRDGRFRLREVPAGTYVLRASAPGFLERVRPGVDVKSAATLDLTIALESDPRLVEDVVVTPGHHEIVPQELGAVRSLGRDDVIAAPTLGSDPSRVVTLLPGIAATDASATFNARGSATKDVSLILDGLELYDPFHLSAFQSPFSFVDGRMVDSVDFVSGGFTADRGDRNGGFLEMSSVTPAETGSTELEVGTLNSRVAYAAPTPVGPLVVSGRYWYPEAIGDTIAFGADGLRPTFGDLYVKLGFLATPTTVVSGHALLASDRASLLESGGIEQVASSNRSGYLWFRVLRSWSPAVTTDTVMSAGRIGRFHRGIAEPGGDVVAVADRRNVRFVGVRNDLTFTIGGSNALRAGLDVDFLNADLEHTAGPPVPTSTVAVSRSGAAIGAYAAYRTALWNRVVTEVGLRWDRQTYTGNRQWSPRFNLVWQAGQRTEVRIAAGRYAQSLRIHELRIEDGETTYRPPELCQALDLSYIHRFSGRWSLRVDAYRHQLGRLQPRYENLFHPLELFPEVEADRFLVVPESATLQGLEVSVRGDAGAPLQWLVNATWSTATDVVSGLSVPRSWDQTYAGNFLVAYRWRLGWFLSVSGTIHTGWPTTPVTGSVVTLPDGSTEIQPVVGLRNSARFPTYARLDLKTGRAISTSKGNVRVELSIVNLTNRQNACCVDEFSFAALPDGRIDTQTTFDYWMGITPSFQVLWTF